MLLLLTLCISFVRVQWIFLYHHTAYAQCQIFSLKCSTDSFLAKSCKWAHSQRLVYSTRKTVWEKTNSNYAPPSRQAIKNKKGQDETKTNKRQTRHLLLCIFAKLLHFDRPTLWQVCCQGKGISAWCVATRTEVSIWHRSALGMQRIIWPAQVNSKYIYIFKNNIQTLIMGTSASTTPLFRCRWRRISLAAVDKAEELQFRFQAKPT